MHEADGYSPGQMIRNALLVAAITYPLVTHPTQAHNALEALQPGYFECGIPITPDTRVGVLVPGGGMKVNALGEFVPNAHSDERIRAAALLFAQRPENTWILLLDGPPDPSDRKNGYAGIERLQSAYKEVTGSNQTIPSDRIARGQTGINTSEGMEDASHLARTLHLEAFLVLTQKYQVERATVFACNEGLHVSPRLVEDVLGIAPRDYPFKVNLKERLEVALAYFDPDGNIPTYLKSQQINRNQVNPEEILKENIVYRRNGKR